MLDEKEHLYKEIGIQPKVLEFGQAIEADLKERFENIDQIAEYNQLKVMIHWKKYMHLCFIQKVRWYVHRLLVAHMLWLWHLVRI